ncbi:hypothetical protein F511_31559 [Dorcoceras hygrometricum]|uniref:Uncharacterized protein n=1 Tax=Dorcoceras hygrometricum TaxID=472368 RepID=A0A2Z7ATZ9_9LAMI|nr:hypothetical protein F511_31559 [Dorcoceras hygrometricum]
MYPGWTLHHVETWSFGNPPEMVVRPRANPDLEESLRVCSVVLGPRVIPNLVVATGRSTSPQGDKEPTKNRNKSKANGNTSTAKSPCKNVKVDRDMLLAHEHSIAAAYNSNCKAPNEMHDARRTKPVTSSDDNGFKLVGKKAKKVKKKQPLPKICSSSVFDHITTNKPSGDGKVVVRMQDNNKRDGGPEIALVSK